MPNESLTKLEQVSLLLKPFLILWAEYVWNIVFLSKGSKCRLFYSTARYSKMRLFEMSELTEVTFVHHVDLNSDMGLLSKARGERVGPPLGLVGTLTFWPARPCKLLAFSPKPRELVFSQVLQDES